MKRWSALIALLLCFAMTAACSAREVLDDVAQQLSQDGEEQAATETVTEDGPEAALPAGGQRSEDGSAMEETAASETDTAAGQPEEESPLPEEDGAQETDLTALAVEDCIAEEDGLPHIVLDCDGAAAINQAVEESFRYLVGDSACTLYYECYKGAGRVLSLLMVQQYDGGSSYYTPYNLDLATGRWISGQELLDIVGLSASQVAETELELMGNEFEYQYGGFRDGELGGFYQEQYDRTVAPDNADTNRLWFGNGGRLNFVARIFAVAGAEYYEYPMNTGYYF